MEQPSQTSDKSFSKCSTKSSVVYKKKKQKTVYFYSDFYNLFHYNAIDIILDELKNYDKFIK